MLEDIKIGSIVCLHVPVPGCIDNKKIYDAIVEHVSANYVTCKVSPPAISYTAWIKFHRKNGCEVGDKTYLCRTIHQKEI